MDEVRKTIARLTTDLRPIEYSLEFSAETPSTRSVSDERLEELVTNAAERALTQVRAELAHVPPVQPDAPASMRRHLEEFDVAIRQSWESLKAIVLAQDGMVARSFQMLVRVIEIHNAFRGL